MYVDLCLCSLMVKQRIYIPCATDNWPMWVRLPPEAPISSKHVDAHIHRLYNRHINNAPVAERSNAVDCKSAKS